MRQRHTIERPDHLEYGFWLTFTRAGEVRLTRGIPSTGPGERAMSCTARLPKALFQTPQLSAVIEVAAPDAGAMQIDVSAAEEALRKAIGCEVQLSVTGGATNEGR